MKTLEQIQEENHFVSFQKPIPELRNGYKDKKHLAEIALMSCVVCDKIKEKSKTRLEVHHSMRKGLGLKASDLLTLPLCSFHHRTGNAGEAIHQGRNLWEKEFGTQEELLKIIVIKINNKKNKKIIEDFLSITNNQ